MPIWILPEVKEYKKFDFRALTIKERLEVYAKLTKKQRELIDVHRKYLIRSEFLKDSYLKASDWEFLDLKIDSNYPGKTDNQKLLYCQCGRRLKYQYIVKSKETGEVMTLGIQHFKDHLNIPQQVATEIVERLNNVDFALDELLWLKRYGVEFPMELWEVYAYYLYQQQYSSNQYSINYSLAQRLIDFKDADMPLYISDFNEIQQEIEALKKNQPKKMSDLTIEETFHGFKNNLSTDLKVKSLFNQALIWSEQIQKRIKSEPEEPVLPVRFFEEIFNILQQESSDRKKKLADFSNKGMGKWIQKEVYDHLLIKIDQYGLNVHFLNQIHPFMRKGLYPFIGLLESPEKKEDKRVKNKVEEITSLLKEFDNETQVEIVTRLNECLGLHK